MSTGDVNLLAVRTNLRNIFVALHLFFLLLRAQHCFKSHEMLMQLFCVNTDRQQLSYEVWLPNLWFDKASNSCDVAQVYCVLIIGCLWHLISFKPSQATKLEVEKL